MGKNLILNTETLNHIFFLRIKQAAFKNSILKSTDFVVPVLINKNGSKFKNLETDQIYTILNTAEQQALQRITTNWNETKNWFNLEHQNIFNPVKNALPIHHKNDLENTYHHHEPQLIAIYKVADLQKEIFDTAKDDDVKNNIKVNMQRPTHLSNLNPVEMTIKSVLKLAKSAEIIFNIENRNHYQQRKQSQKIKSKNKDSLNL